MTADRRRDPDVYCAIRIALAAAGVTIQDVSAATGLSHGAASAYLNGIHYGAETRGKIEAAARKFGVEIGDDPWRFVRVGDEDRKAISKPAAGGKPGISAPVCRAREAWERVKAAGVSLREWARAAGVARSSLTDFLSGKAKRRWLPDKIAKLEAAAEKLDAGTRRRGDAETEERASLTGSAGVSPAKEGGQDARPPGRAWDVFLRDSKMLDETVLKHFGLARDPFKNEIETTDQVWKGVEFRRTYDKVKDGLRKRDFIALWAPIGTGKTILWKSAVDELRRQPQKWKFIFPRSAHRARITPSALYDALTEGLCGKIYCSSLQAKAGRAQSLLEDADAAGQTVVMIVDESHCLRRDVLRSLKLFLEHGIGFKRLLSILLIGQPELRVMLSDVDLAEVGRRVTLIELGGVHVQGGRAAELAQFLEQKIKPCRRDAGGTNIWDSGALKAIGELRNIYPAQETRDRNARTLPPILIQNVFAKAMELCAESSVKAVVTGEYIEAAVREARA